MESLDETIEARRLYGARSDLCNLICAIGRSGDLSLLLAAECNIIAEDLNRHANSSAMVSSLKTALIELNVIKKHVKFVADSEKYQLINEGYSLSKNRKNGLPYDEARQAMASHYARLSNLDKSRLTAVEKSIIDARKQNIKTAQRLYEKMQEKAIGLKYSC
ncbi:hypothetical protein [Bartonella harrusi]|uniref:Uncharacterized protein n=1 Tax=Bartonella harrusi TaxID=2961895 RepID=A0ABY5EV45_9HYPH|nr:hypothetical protein [Bartonella harrusi]UTO27845.1 hypothetical protein NMK50_06255 [Bartonella harrusi]